VSRQGSSRALAVRARRRAAAARHHRDRVLPVRHPARSGRLRHRARPASVRVATLGDRRARRGRRRAPLAAAAGACGARADPLPRSPAGRRIVRQLGGGGHAGPVAGWTPPRLHRLRQGRGRATSSFARSPRSSRGWSKAPRARTPSSGRPTASRSRSSHLSGSPASL
jgi:hypothetical protein